MPSIFDLWTDMMMAGNGTFWFLPTDIDLNDGGASVYNTFKNAAGKTPAEVLGEAKPSDGKMIKSQLINAHALAMYRAFLLRNLTPSRAFIISSNSSPAYPQMYVKSIIDSFDIEGKETTI